MMLYLAERIVFNAENNKARTPTIRTAHKALVNLVLNIFPFMSNVKYFSVYRIRAISAFYAHAFLLLGQISKMLTQVHVIRQK